MLNQRLNLKISQILLEGGKTSDNLTLYLSDGDYYITGVENGKSVEYYEDGSKLYEGNWINGKQDGVIFVMELK